jgi:hypothetical protein
MKGDELTILTNEAVPAAQVTPQFIANEQAKLNAITGDDKTAMDRRTALQQRISTARQLAKA